MRRGQNASILHMILQIPELGQAHALNVDNVGGIRNGYLGVRSFEGGNKRQDEIEQVVVQREQRQQFSWRLQFLVVGQSILVLLCLFLVFANGFRVEVLDVEEIDGNAAFVSAAGPLRILAY